MKRFRENTKQWPVVSDHSEVGDATQIVFTLFYGPHDGHALKLDGGVVPLGVRQATGGAVDEAQLVILISLDQSVTNAEESGGISQELGAQQRIEGLNNCVTAQGLLTLRKLQIMNTEPDEGDALLEK